MIHPTASVDPGAHLAEGVSIGPFSVVEAGAVLGEGVALGPHAVVHGCVTIGARTQVGAGTVLGGEPQDFKYKGEPTRVEIGAGCRIHEHVTVHRGTSTGLTQIGAGVMLMAGSHVGHDCRVGDHVILTNDAKLGGHVSVGERAILSANATVHQFCRVGRLTMLGGQCGIGKDAVPFSILSGALPAAWRGPNVIGLRRAGFSAADRHEIRRALIALLSVPGVVRKEAEARHAHPLEAVRELARFVLESKRGVVLARHARALDGEPD